MSSERTRAAVGTMVFFLVAPAVVTGLIPWWLTGWHARDLPAWWIPLRVLAVLLILAGAAVLVHAFARFAREGVGTPAPIAPTRHLVVGGLYRYVRNPMYLAVFAVIFGQALLLGRVVLVWYGLAVVLACVLFVLGYEQPALTRRFGGEYLEYRRNVPGWWPRLTPWQS
jgi:protein-S-isoprenylcysteine O-methyltransferase Ste14